MFLHTSTSQGLDASRCSGSQLVPLECCCQLWDRCHRKFQQVKAAAVKVRSSQTAGSLYEESVPPLPLHLLRPLLLSPFSPPPPHPSATKHLLHKTVQESAPSRRWHWIAPVQPWSLNDLHAVSGPFLCLVPLSFSWPLVVLLCSTPLWTFSHFSAAFPLSHPLAASITLPLNGRRWRERRKAILIGPPPPFATCWAGREREGSSIFPVCFVSRVVLFVNYCPKCTITSMTNSSGINGYPTQLNLFSRVIFFLQNCRCIYVDFFKWNTSK